MWVDFLLFSAGNELQSLFALLSWLKQSVQRFFSKDVACGLVAIFNISV